MNNSKLAHKMVDVVDRVNKEICVSILQYNMDKTESFFLKFDFSQGSRMTKIVNTLSLWKRHLLSLFLYSRYWTPLMMNLLLINPSVVSCRKYLQLLTLYIFSLPSNQVELEHLSYKEPICQAKIKIET